MAIVTGQSTSSSRHPRDWGRAVALALDSLVAQSQNAETDLETSELFGSDLTLTIQPLTIAHDGDGAMITLTWHRPDGTETLPTQ